MNEPLNDEKLAVLQDKQVQLNRLVDLQASLSEAQALWQEAEALAMSLSAYYQSEQWLADHDEADAFLSALSAVADMPESGGTVLSQDAIWDALEAQYQLALGWMRRGLDSIEK